MQVRKDLYFFYFFAILKYMKLYDLIIVGGGVAGYFSAIKLLEKDNTLKILILEKQASPLQKLLTTGSGACNFSHSGTVEYFLQRYGKNGQFLRNAFYNFFVDDIISFFEENGIKVRCREDGKYFPESMKAQEIKDLFLQKVKNIETKLQCNVVSVHKNDDVFFVNTIEGPLHAKKVLITTGGKSFPKTGSTGDGYDFAKYFGHSIIKQTPSLASIYAHNHDLASFSGIAFHEAMVRVGKKSFTGALLITHKGYSGPVIIDNSRDFSENDTLTISFLQTKRAQLESTLFESKNETIFTAFKRYEFPKKLLQHFCNYHKIDTTKKLCEISHKQIILLLDTLFSYPVVIKKVEGFETCMCTAGGISLKEINPKTFESKLETGLYFLGEVLDIDGDSGGYNLQAIWSECATFAENFY